MFKQLHEAIDPFTLCREMDEHFPLRADIWSAFPKPIRTLVGNAVNEHRYEKQYNRRGNGINRRQQQQPKIANIHNRMEYYRKHPDIKSHPLQYSIITKKTNANNFPIKLYNHALHGKELREEVMQRNPIKSTRYYFIHSKTHLTESKFNSISTKLQMHNNHYWNILQQMRMRNYFIERINGQDYEAIICTKCNKQAQCTAYHRMVECEGEDDARTNAIRSTKQRMETLKMMPHIEAMTKQHREQKTRINDLRTKLNYRYPNLNQYPLWPNELEIAAIEEKGRHFGILVDDEYHHITKKKGEDRTTQITQLYTKIENFLDKDPKNRRTYPQDSTEIMSDPDHITYYLTTKDFQSNNLGLKIINDHNNSNINDTLRQLVTYDEDLYKLIAPDPTTNSTLTQTVLYCLAYYIIWHTNSKYR